ncbi:MAG: MFS transporter [Dehalococcoidales bacterium]|nr:MFS transporter [Dehalococcoidales bacterium]
MTNHKPSPSTEAKAPRFFYGYVIVLASFLVLMIVFGAQYSFGVFFKPVLSEFGWTRAATSGAYALNTILMGSFSIFTGRLSDRFGPRLVVTVCGSLLGLGYLLMSQINAIWQMYLFYGVLISAGTSGMWVPLLSTATRWFAKRRGLASGIIASGTGFGTVIMPPLANHLISSYNWRTSYAVIGLIALVVIIISAQFLRRDPAQKGLLAYGAAVANTESPHLKVAGISIKEAIRTNQFWVICIFGFCAYSCLQTVMVHIVPHATDIGITAAAAATILSTFGFLSIGGKLVLGGVIDRIGSKRVAIIVFTMMAASFLWLLAADELWMMYLFAAIFGIGFGGFAVVQSPMVAEYFGLKEHGAIFGLVSFVNNLGSAIGPFTAGSIFDKSNSYYWAFLFCAILGALGLTVSIILKSSQQKKLNNEESRQK